MLCVCGWIVVLVIVSVQAIKNDSHEEFSIFACTTVRPLSLYNIYIDMIIRQICGVQGLSCLK